MKRTLFTALLTGIHICYGQESMHMKHHHETASTDSTDLGNMGHAFSRRLPMSRNGSGTAWNPDAAPIYGIMKHKGSWMYMFHGDIFPRYVKQDLGSVGNRGGDRVDAPDMLMAMGQRTMGEKGLLHFNVMLSTDAIITGQRGYPLLFQTGESAHGVPLVDRQHPHDLFSELSVSYAHALSQKSDAFLYVGYPGEPALGPVTFMHRISAQFIPDAPIGHHWQDATHVTFGVATAGLRLNKIKLEVSSFTGREPGENRYNFDKPRFDSWSGRLSCNPNEHWALQVSHGFLNSPEAIRPDENVNRTTASATYVQRLNRRGFFAATGLWGQNATDHYTANSLLIEATLKPRHTAVYTRYERVQKTAEELWLNPLYYGGLGTVHPLSMATFGCAYDLLRSTPLIVALGAQVSIYNADKELQPIYGSYPLGAEIYLHIYPRMLNM